MKVGGLYVSFFHFSVIYKKTFAQNAKVFGWGAGIRTPEVTESESVALPLGDTPVSFIFTSFSFYIIARPK